MLIAPTSGDELHRRLLSTVFGFVAQSCEGLTNKLQCSIAVLLNYRDGFNTESVSLTTCLLLLTAWLMILRFSEDMQLVDKSLPPAILSLCNRQYLQTSSYIHYETFLTV